MSLRESGITLIDCDHRTPPAAGSGYPYVAIPQIKQGRIDLTDVRRITPEHFAGWTRKANPRPFDVVLSRRCNPGETAFVPPGLQFAVGQNLVLLRADGRRVEPRFLRWLVRGPEWWEQVQKFLNVGAVFDSLRCADVPNFELPMPPLNEQRAISHILGTLDDKIELNRRTNETLEAMARALFKSWFVDFDPVRAKAEGRQPSGMDAETAKLFPSEFVESELGEIPRGWRVVPLGTLATFENGDRSSNYPKERDFVEHGVPFVDAGDLESGFVAYHAAKKISRDACDRLRAGKVRNGDLLYCLRGSPGRVARVRTSNEAAIASSLVIIRGLSTLKSVFLYHQLSGPAGQQMVTELDNGSAQPNVSVRSLSQYPVVLAPDAVLERFFEPITADWDLLAHNRAQNEELTAIRDTLLPRLLSGELPVGDAERVLEAQA
jgi:type I restriction enzyme S subunit